MLIRFGERFLDTIPLGDAIGIFFFWTRTHKM